MRLIDADALIECLQTWRTAAASEGLPINERFAVAMIAQVNLMPTIEPERKKGEWIGYLEPGNENYHCSACGTAWYPEDLYLGGNDYPKYCPECGAQMENWQSDTEEGEQDEPDKQTD